MNSQRIARLGTQTTFRPPQSAAKHTPSPPPSLFVDVSLSHSNGRSVYVLFISVRLVLLPVMPDMCMCSHAGTFQLRQKVIFCLSAAQRFLLPAPLLHHRQHRTSSRNNAKFQNNTTTSCLQNIVGFLRCGGVSGEAHEAPSCIQRRDLVW